MRTVETRSRRRRRAAGALRNILGLCVGVAILAAGCATSGDGRPYGDGYDGHGYYGRPYGTGLMTPERECYFNGGVWRPHIAGGYCEPMK